MKTRHFILGGTLLAALLFPGCGESEHPRPPNERNRMVIKLFNSMEKGDGATAAEQADRLQALNRDSLYLRTASDTQHANAVVAAANRKLAAGDLAGAAAVLEAGRSRHPLNDQIAASAAVAARLTRLNRALRRFTSETLPSEQMEPLCAEAEAELAAFPDTPDAKAIAAKLRRALLHRQTVEALMFRLFCDNVIAELSSAETPDAELRSTVRTLRQMGAALR